MIFPFLGRIIPLIKRNKVLLPLPLAPTSIHKPGSLIENEQRTHQAVRGIKKAFKEYL